jgi:hypothetical protein
MKAMITKVGICVWLGVITIGALLGIYFTAQFVMDLVKALG